ncbi:MAG: methyltransferase domain-containing protein [Actinomycetota bacterium]|nr:MAG: methyltransferase domain-containing protein [Actinomycetota bacterium]
MQIADIFALVAGPDFPVEFTAYDGSRTGQPGAPVRVEVRRPRAMSYFAASPGQLGLARGYVAGDLEIHGDLHAALTLLWDIKNRPVSVQDKARIARELAPYLLKREAPPPEEAHVSGWRQHTRRRDAAAIHHHYDVSNRFYAWVLGPSMAYTCAVYPDADASLEQAQEEKFDLVCRKLALRPGMRLLDVGCGWGGMVMHAVKNYGVTAIGATLSQQQAEWAQQGIADAGLQDRAEVRFCDYRDVPESDFDAISSIGLTEHIGKANYPSYFASLHRKLRPGGRLLNHSITRADDKGKTQYRGGFINRYVFPDGELTGPAAVLTAMTGEGFELRHSENLREHYALTLRAWGDNLEENWAAAVDEVGIRRARIWRLYMAASRMGFDRNMIQLHQFLAVKPHEDGRSDVELRLDFERARNRLN